MRWLVLLAAFLTTIACVPPPVADGRASAARTPSTSGPPQSSSTASPQAGPLSAPVAGYAVLVDLFSGDGTYDLSIVAGDGRVASSAHPRLRSTIGDSLELPYVSASNTRVYYLDGDSAVRFLKPNGETG